MRFCFVTTFFPPLHFGGDALFVARLANALANRGHDVEVIHCADAYEALGGTAVEAKTPEWIHPEIVVHTLRSRLGFVSPVWTQQIGTPGPKAKELKRLLARDFDVIHFHNISLIGGPGVLAYGNAIKLYTVHEYWLVCPAHMLFRMNREACGEARGCARCMVAHRRPPQAWRATGLLERSIGHIDAFLSPSRYGIEIHKRFGFPGALRYLPNFHPSTHTHVGEVERAPNTFLYAGRLERLKGVAPLVDFFKRWPQGDLRIAGVGSEREALEGRAGGAGNIHFLGSLDHETLQKEYGRAAALIVPTLGSEQFPLVVLEALANGTPVVANDSGPLREIVEESRGGFIYRDETELEDILAELIARPEVGRAKGKEGRERAHEKWSEQAHLVRYFATIDEIRNARDAG